MEKPVTSTELAAFDDSVASLLNNVWGDATACHSSDVAELWTIATTRGWFELGPAGALDLAMAATRRLGRAACPLPIIDNYAASQLINASAVAAGTLRLVLTTDPTAFIDAGGAATHVLVVPPDGGYARLFPIVEQAPVAGLAIPAWTRAELGTPEAEFAVTREQADIALVLTRLGKAARALAAAERAHEMAIEHAKVRSQFGKVIGGFGAVQQRTAQCQINVRSANLLLAEAISALQCNENDAVLAAEVAVAYIASVAPTVQFGAHHTLAAMGYFEEHAAPWLFRRVHSDIALLSTLELGHGSVGDVLVETASRLPAVSLGGAGEGFLREFRQFIDDHDARDKALTPTRVDPDVIRAMADKGWFGCGWSPEYGGRDASLADQVILTEQTAYHRVGAVKALSAVTMIGSSILRHGTEEQKDRFLPLIRSGNLNFCLGYSEPETGSDLASLRTRAVRSGDEWTINGQKLWTTDAHASDWVWLATRTDPDARPRHAGITIFLLPLDTPGITIQRHIALSGEVSCSVFYDDVRVPDSARIGEINGGWAVILEALAGERIAMGNIAASMHRQLDDLLDYVADDPVGTLGRRGSAKRATLTELAVRVQATRVLVGAAVKASATDMGAMFDAAMAGVMGGDLAEDFGEATLSIFGPVAALSGDGTDTAIPGGGAFEYGLRQSIMYVVGGGTNDVQRGLIARGLGLPR